MAIYKRNASVAGDARSYGLSSSALDNTAAINRAIAAQSASGVVDLPTGTFNFTGQILIDDVGVIVRGNRRGTKLVYTGEPTSQPVVLFIRTVDTFEGVGQGLENVWITTTEPEAVGVQFRGPLQATVRDVWIEGFAGIDGDAWGLDMGNTVEALNCRIDNVTLQSNGRGIRLNGNAHCITNIVASNNLLTQALVEDSAAIGWLGGTIQGSGHVDHPGMRVTSSHCFTAMGLYFEMTDATACFLVDDSSSQIELAYSHVTGADTPICDIKVDTSNFVALRGNRHFGGAAPADRAIQADSCVGLLIISDSAAANYATSPGLIDVSGCGVTWIGGAYVGGTILGQQISCGVGAVPSNLADTDMQCTGVKAATYVGAGGAIAATGSFRMGATSSIMAMVGSSDVPVVDIGGGACIYASGSWSAGVFVDSPAAGITFRPGGGSEFVLTSERAIFDVPIEPESYAVASPPSAVAVWRTAVFTNGDAGDPCYALYDGSNWRRIVLGATVAAS